MTKKEKNKLIEILQRALDKFDEPYFDEDSIENLLYAALEFFPEES